MKNLQNLKMIHKLCVHVVLGWTVIIKPFFLSLYIFLSFSLFLFSLSLSISRSLYFEFVWHKHVCSMQMLLEPDVRFFLTNIIIETENVRNGTQSKNTIRITQANTLIQIKWIDDLLVLFVRYLCKLDIFIRLFGYEIHVKNGSVVRTVKRRELKKQFG